MLRLLEAEFIEAPKRRSAGLTLLLHLMDMKVCLKVSKLKQCEFFNGMEILMIFPSTANIMAFSNLYPQAFKVGSAIGMQFHLEVNRKMIERWIQEYSQEINKEHIKSDDILLPNKAKEIRDSYDRCKVVYSNFSKMIHKFRGKDVGVR